MESSPNITSRQTAAVRHHCHGHADGADRASVYERALAGRACASAHGSLRPQISHERDRDASHRADGDVDVSSHRGDGHAHASR